MNKLQIIGIGLIIIAIVVYFSFENSIIQTISGVLCGIGLALILKLLDFEKQDVAE